jgi:hypothetical protein
MDQIDLDRYSGEQISSLFLNYEGLVEELPELYENWDEMDAMERDHHRAMFGQAWGYRYVLGRLFRAGKFSQMQEARLERLDRQLLRQSQLAYVCYGLSNRQMMKLFVWGTPLALSHQVLQIDFDPRVLNEMALAWAGYDKRLVVEVQSL